MMNPEIERMRGGLIVSCQAPSGSPLDDPVIIAALALTAELNGAKGVRINGPDHIRAVRRRVGVPILGIEKIQDPESEVYITPTFESAQRIAESGATVVALDATRRRRPGGETVDSLVRRIRTELGLPVMADIATFEEGRYAAACGADMVATTLCGYTHETRDEPKPALNLVRRLAQDLPVPVVCEGGISTPDEARRALACGAFAVVVGTAITGVGQLVSRFAAACRPPEPRP